MALQLDGQQGGTATETTGLPRRSRHRIDWSGLTLPTPEDDDYSGSPVELPTSEPGSPNFSHVFDSASEFCYPNADGVQMTAMPYNGYFRAIAFLAVKNDNASSQTLYVKATTTIGGDTRSTTAATNPSAITSGNYAALHATWHPYAYGTQYPYRYTGFASGDTYAVSIWASGTSVNVHHAAWLLIPVVPTPSGGSNEGDFDVQWPYNEPLVDMRIASSPPVTTVPSWTTVGSNTSPYIYIGDDTVMSIGASTYFGFAMVNARRDVTSTVRCPPVFDFASHWNSPASPYAVQATDASAWPAITSLPRWPAVLYFTALPGRAGSTWSGQAATSPC